jgi:hypothetical protein
MAPQTMTHLPGGFHPGRVRTASQRFLLGVLLSLALATVPGCYHHYPTYPDEKRAASPCPYSLVLNGPWPQVHQAVTAAAQHMTWGPHYSIQHPIDPELGRGTVDPLYVLLSPGVTGPGVVGFVADVERLTDNTTKLTIYPDNERWKDITRQEIAEVVERQFPPLPPVPK